MDISELVSSKELEDLENRVILIEKKIDLVLEKIGFKKKWIMKPRYSYYEQYVFDTEQELQDFKKKNIKKHKINEWDYEIITDFSLEVEDG